MLVDGCWCMLQLVDMYKERFVEERVFHSKKRRLAVVAHMCRSLVGRSFPGKVAFLALSSQEMTNTMPREAMRHWVLLLGLFVASCPD